MFATRFVNDARQILTSSDMKLLHEKETLNVQNLDVMERNRTLMEKFLKKGTLEEVESFVAAYFEEIPKENLQSSLMRQYITMDIYIVASSFCGKLGIPSSERAGEARNLEMALQRVTTAAGVKKYVGNLLKDTIERRDT